MNTRLHREQLRQGQFVRRGALMGALYSSVVLLAIGGAGFRLWPETLFGMVALGYLCGLIFAYAMSVFFFVHMEKRPILTNDTVIAVGDHEVLGLGEESISALNSLDLPPEAKKS